ETGRPVLCLSRPTPPVAPCLNGPTVVECTTDATGRPTWKVSCDDAAGAGGAAGAAGARGRGGGGGGARGAGGRVGGGRGRGGWRGRRAVLLDQQLRRGRGVHDRRRRLQGALRLQRPG